MRRYQCHKTVEAGKIVAVGADCYGVVHELVVRNGDSEGTEVMEMPKGFSARGVPEVGDYLVRYKDGYLSWSPAKAFEEGYTLADGAQGPNR